MTVRGAERITKRYRPMLEYAAQDGLHQWYREFIWQFEKENPDLLAAIRYAAEVHEGCPNRVDDDHDDDHDDYCRSCGPFLYLTTGAA